VVEHRHPGRRTFGRTDRRSSRPPPALASQRRDLRGGFAVDGLCRLAVDAQRDALLYRARDRRRVPGSSDLDRRLRAAAAARHDDHGFLHRGAARRFLVRSGRGAVVAQARLAERLRVGRDRAARDAAGAVGMVARVAALPGSKRQSFAAPGGAVAQARHHAGAGQRGPSRHCPRQPDQNAVRRRLRAADRPPLRDLLLQPAEPVFVRLLAAPRFCT